MLSCSLACPVRRPQCRAPARRISAGAAWLSMFHPDCPREKQGRWLSFRTGCPSYSVWQFCHAAKSSVDSEGNPEQRHRLSTRAARPSAPQPRPAVWKPRLDTWRGFSIRPAAPRTASPESGRGQFAGGQETAAAIPAAVPPREREVTPGTAVPAEARHVADTMDPRD